MLINISHEFHSKKPMIEKEIGKILTLSEREKIGGIHHSGLTITAASLEIFNLLALNSGESTCSIEIRSKGILMSFGIQKEVYALLIPHYKLKIYKGRATEYSFYRDHHFIKIRSTKETHRFVRKIIDHQIENGPTRVEDLL